MRADEAISCMALLSYGTRQAQHTQASNPNALKERKTKEHREKEAKERKTIGVPSRSRSGVSREESMALDKVDFYQRLGQVVIKQKSSEIYIR